MSHHKQPYFPPSFIRISNSTPDHPLIMASPCLFCKKTFASSVALKDHTAARHQLHACSKCNQTFCSKKAMKKHRDSPNHVTAFRCRVCGKHFKDGLALKNHDLSIGHTQKLIESTSIVKVVGGGPPKAKAVCLLFLISQWRTTPILNDRTGSSIPEKGLQANSSLGLHERPFDS